MKSAVSAQLSKLQARRFGLLAIASFIIHYLGWQASNMFWGHLSDAAIVQVKRPHVNTPCRYQFEMASRSIAAKPSSIQKGCLRDPFYAKAYRPTSVCSASGYRSPWTSMPEKAISISLRSSAESSTSVDPRFSSRR